MTKEEELLQKLKQEISINMSLLEQAKKEMQPATRTSLIPTSYESIEIVFSVLEGKVTYRQAVDMLNEKFGSEIKNTGTLSHLFPSIIRNGILEGLIVVNRDSENKVKIRIKK